MTIKDKEQLEKELWLKAFGNYLKKVRKGKGISAAELGRRIAMDPPNITRLEKGQVNPSLYLLKKICDSLNLSLHEFFDDF